MTRTVEIAPAKINYWLSVGEKRPDGYHDVSTLMQTVSLCDRLTIDVSEGDFITLEIRGAEGLSMGQDNLAVRAAQVFLHHYGHPLGIHILLEKRIPIAGGLAGGSADAAAVLRGLNRALGCPFSIEQLMDMGAEFGSDISFCVVGGLAHCTGRGEIVEPLEPTPKYYFLIANGGESVSTQVAFSELDASPSMRQFTSVQDCYEALIRGDASTLQGQLYNRFEDSVLPRCPIASGMLSVFRSLGASALMSGSGSTVYAVFSNEEEAKNMQAILPFKTHYAESVFPILDDKAGQIALEEEEDG